MVRALLAHATGDTASVFNASPAMYHCVTDQFVGGDGLGNLVVLNDGSNFTKPGTYALTQTGPNSISYAYLVTTNGYNVVTGNIAGASEPTVALQARPGVEARVYQGRHCQLCER